MKLSEQILETHKKYLNLTEALKYRIAPQIVRPRE